MMKKTDYSILVLRNNGSIDVFYFTSPVDLHRAFRDGINELKQGEVIRKVAFGKTLETYDSEKGQN